MSTPEARRFCLAMVLLHFAGKHSAGRCWGIPKSGALLPGYFFSCVMIARFVFPHVGHGDFNVNPSTDLGLTRTRSEAIIYRPFVDQKEQRNCEWYNWDDSPSDVDFKKSICNLIRPFCDTPADHYDDTRRCRSKSLPRFCK